MIVNLIDIDGTLCKSIFTNDRIKNDNRNCLNIDFINDLANLDAFDWANGVFLLRSCQQVGLYVDIIVTGRLPELEKVTRDWWYSKFGTSLHGYVSVSWNDNKNTHEESYKDYVFRKGNALLDISKAWKHVCWESNIPLTIIVYEDDKNVLARMDLLKDVHKIPAKLLLIVDGKAPIEFVGE